jgi:hypothetical protein
MIEKYNLITDGPAKHIAASATSGVGVCIAMHPGISYPSKVNVQPIRS